MTKRADGKGKGRARDPNGWYVETRTSVEQVADAISFAETGEPDVIYDPACGGGMILDVMAGRGHACIGSDIIERPRWGRNPFRFYRGNYLNLRSLPTAPPGRSISVFSNPPYNEPEPQIAEEFVHRTLSLVDFHRAAFIVPIEFACGQGRYERLYSKRRPSHVLFFCERPSMPPGEELSIHGEAIRGGGMADYVCMIWTRGGPFRTEALFLKPSAVAALPDIPRRSRAGQSLGSAIEPISRRA